MINVTKNELMNTSDGKNLAKDQLIKLLSKSIEEFINKLSKK